jgi:hypothetical protein
LGPGAWGRTEDVESLTGRDHLVGGPDDGKQRFVKPRRINNRPHGAQLHAQVYLPNRDQWEAEGDRR